MHTSRSLLLFSALIILAQCTSVEPAVARPANDYWTQERLRMEDHVYSPTVRTVQLFKKGFELAPPVIELNSADVLVLRFDDLQPNIENLSYTVVHCDADWQPSDLMPGQYLTGAMSDYIPAGEQSYNTLQPFIQYELEFPNDMMRIGRSGNYLLKVYRGSDQDDLVLTRRFLVYEQKVQIDARVLASRNVELRDAAQQVDFTIRHTQLPVQDAFRDIKVAVLQNMRWDDLRTGFKPRFVRGSELVYDFPEPGLFMGNNEFRNIDLKDLRMLTQRVMRIEPGPGDNLTEAWVAPETKRNIRVYFDQPDLNGRYLVRNDWVDGDPLGADYVLVHFTLPMAAPLQDDVYVYGGFSDFQCRKENRMTWSEENMAYTASIVMKQGFIDFTYATLGTKSTVPDLTTIEGSHFQTENDYLLLVYFTDFQQRCDRLVGMRFVNSRRG